MKAPIPAEEEQMVADYIYYQYLIDYLEKDLSAVYRLPFKIPEVYEGLIETTIRNIRKDLIPLKQKMRELKIRVEKGYMVNEDFIEYPYFAHGYEGLMRFWTHAMRLEGTKKLSKYLNVH